MRASNRINLQVFYELREIILTSIFQCLIDIYLITILVNLELAHELATQLKAHTHTVLRNQTTET